MAAIAIPHDTPHAPKAAIHYPAGSLRFRRSRLADETGEVIDYENTTPISYAKALAYLPDPSAIRAGVARQFGAARAPSIDQCRNLRTAYLESRKLSGAKCQERYGRNFKCEHPQTEANTTITLNGLGRCKTCADAAREEKRLENERAAEKLKAHFEAQAKLDAAQRLYSAAVREAQAAKAAQVRLLGSEVIEVVARLFMMEPYDIISDNRFPRYVDARGCVAYIIRQRGLSYTQIGRIMKRDHSTIMNLIQKLDIYKARNPMVAHVLGIVT